MSNVVDFNAGPQHPRRQRAKAFPAAVRPKPAEPLHELPAPVCTGGEQRAFLIYDRVPPGHVEFTMPDDRHAPHVRAGETVLADTSDREFISGELYLIQWQSSHRLDVMQVSRRKEGIWFTPLVKYRTQADVDHGFRTGRIYMSDGPLKPEYVDLYLKGRVVGILQPREARHG